MIGWGMNLTFYVIAGSIAAFQRLMDEKIEKQVEEFNDAVQLGMLEQPQITLTPTPIGQDFNPSLKPVVQAQLQQLVPAVSAVSTAAII
jgi:peptidoglycan/xylan/chitin deacetylase (PgdA/CDA1 family)